MPDLSDDRLRELEAWCDQNICDDWPDADTMQLRDMVAALRELLELRGKLHKTADGVYVVPGVDHVWNWCACDGGYGEKIVVVPGREDWTAVCYSTEAAALAASKEPSNGQE